MTRIILDRRQPEWVDRADVLSQNARAESLPVESAATVSEYSLKAGDGAKHVRWATRVTFPNGRRLEFTEPMSRKYAILQAQNALYLAYRDNWRLTMTDDQKPMSREHFVAMLEKS